MPDVPNTHWAYWDMLEATTDHKFDKSSGSEKWTSFDKETTDLTPGWHNIGGKLFHVNDDKQFDHDKFIGLSSSLTTTAITSPARPSWTRCWFRQ